MTPPEYLRKKSVWAWAMYDFANSAFATTVLAVVFNVYFVQRVVPAEGVRLLGATVPGTSLWGYTVSLSMLIIFVCSPVLGALADHAGRKKSFLALFWLAGCAASAGLFFVRPGDVRPAILLFLVANIGFAGGNVFYNAFLSEIAEPGRMGRVSGFGWAVGYLGGGLCLALNLWMIQSPQTFGLSSEDYLPVRATLLSVGVWWFVFGLPLMFVLRERPGRATEHPAGLLRPAVLRLRETFQNLRRYKNLLTFLAAYLLYNDGIETIILMASVFGAQALGMAQNELILCFLMIQAVAFAGALFFGWLADRLSHKKSILCTLAVYGGVLLWAAAMRARWEFWILGAVVGVVLGGSQAASRSWMALLTPPEKSAEFFAFYGVVGKLTAVLGPLVFGVVSQVWGLRPGVLSLLVFFLAGGALLTRVREKSESPA
ncbi:MAG TPA: MFS transporter [Elusimicrobiota bacterium]|nr:MFS transporter [Elusimicrobiota bacterium]